MRCAWVADSDNKVRVYNFASTASSSPKVAFIVQAKISGSLSVKKAVSYSGFGSANDGKGNKIVDATSLTAGTNVVAT